MKLATVVLMATLAISQTSMAAAPQSETTLLGSWAVDIARLPMPPEVRPKSVTITFSEGGTNRLRAKVEVLDPSGGRLEAEGITPLDGTPTPVKSNFEADMSATSMPRADVLIMQLAKDGHPASTRIYSVNPDGKTMVETVTYFGPDGRPVSRRNYFTRLR